MSTAIEVLRLSHIVMPWLVVTRRLRKERPSFWGGPFGESFWEGPSPTIVAPRAAEATGAAESPPDNQAKQSHKKKNKKKRKAQRAAAEPKEAEPPPATKPLAPSTPEHHTHYCLACRAPVPLAGAPFPCPYCATEIVPPPEVAAAYQRILWAKGALERAERAWKRAVLWNGPLWVFLFALVIIVWSGSYFYLVIQASSQRAALPWTKFDRIVLMASAPSGLFGWWTGVMMAVHKDGLGRIIGSMPRASFKALPPCR
jgi:hypothetical protein